MSNNNFNNVFYFKDTSDKIDIKNLKLLLKKINKNDYDYLSVKELSEEKYKVYLYYKDINKNLNISYFDDDKEDINIVIRDRIEVIHFDELLDYFNNTDKMKGNNYEGIEEEVDIIKKGSLEYVDDMRKYDKLEKIEDNYDLEEVELYTDPIIKKIDNNIEARIVYIDLGENSINNEFGGVEKIDIIPGKEINKIKT